MSAVLRVVPRSVDDEAAEINAEHARFEAKLGEALAHARRAGELLLKVKEQLPHGQFGPWIEKHCEFSRRTAGLYTFLAKKWRTIGDPAKRQRVAEMTLRQAIVELTVPAASEEKTPPTDPTAAQLAEQARTLPDHLRELARVRPGLIAEHLTESQRAAIAELAPRVASILTNLAELTTPLSTAYVHFESPEDVEDFFQKIGRPLDLRTKRITFGGSA